MKLSTTHLKNRYYVSWGTINIAELALVLPFFHETLLIIITLLYDSVQHTKSLLEK